MVVPAYNEAQHITQVIRSIPDCVDSIVIVDDGSTDETVHNAKSVLDPRVSIISHQSNRGLGAAIVTGHKKAIELDVSISVVMAGDGQMNPKYLPNLLDAIIQEGYDYAKGNRFVIGGLEKMPRIRVFGNSVLSFLVKSSSGYWKIFDPQNGYTAIRVLVLKRLYLEKMKTGFQFENDMLVRLNILGCRVKDVAIPASYEKEKSKVRILPFAFQTLIYLFKAFHVRVYRKYLLHDFHPFAALYIAGAALFWWGTMFSLYYIYLRYLSPEHIPPTAASVMVAAVPLFIGIQFLLSALLVDIAEGRTLS